MFARYQLAEVVNRLTTLTDEASQNFTFDYDNANKLISRVMPNGVTTTYDYDGMSRLTRLKDVNTTATLFDRQYAYNTANQISQITDLTETKNFGYDKCRSAYIANRFHLWKRELFIRRRWK